MDNYIPFSLYLALQHIYNSSNDTRCFAVVHKFQHYTISKIHWREELYFSFYDRQCLYAVRSSEYDKIRYHRRSVGLFLGILPCMDVSPDSKGAENYPFSNNILTINDRWRCDAGYMVDDF